MIAFKFPEPPCKRNFIKENMQQLKRMQGMLITDQMSDKPRFSRDKFRTIPKLNKHKTNSTTLPSLRPQKETKSSKSITSQKRDTTAISKKGTAPRKAVSDVKLTDRGVQTERPQDVAKLYERGTIVYPRKNDRKRGKRKEDHGDSISREQIGDVMEKVEGLDLEEKNYVKDNIQAIKQASPNKKDDKDELDKSKVPKNYQKGVLPKYLKNRKDEKHVECDPECPPGHVLLPDEERKETLRVLRQSKCFLLLLYVYIALYLLYYLLEILQRKIEYMKIAFQDGQL